MLAYKAPVCQKTSEAPEIMDLRSYTSMHRIGPRLVLVFFLSEYLEFE